MTLEIKDLKVGNTNLNSQGLFARSENYAKGGISRAAMVSDIAQISHKGSSGKMPDKQSNNMRSLRRCFELMEIFSENQEPMSASDIAKRLDAPLSSIMDLLRCLQELGYLGFDTVNRNYFMTMRVAMLGHWMTENNFNQESYLSILNSLHDQTKETVCAFSMSDLSMVCVASIKGTHPLSFAIAPGERVPTLGSAVGAALMSKWDRKDVEKFITKAESRSDEPIDRKKILTMISKVRKSGYAATYDSIISEVGAVAVVAPTASGSPLVISIGGSSRRIRADEKKIAEVLIKIPEMHI